MTLFQSRKCKLLIVGGSETNFHSFTKVLGTECFDFVHFTEERKNFYDFLNRILPDVVLVIFGSREIAGECIWSCQLKRDRRGGISRVKATFFAITNGKIPKDKGVFAEIFHVDRVQDLIQELTSERIHE